MIDDDRNGGQVLPMRPRRRDHLPTPSGIITEAQAAQVLRAFYRSYGRYSMDVEPSDRQVEAMVDALVLTFDLRLVQ